MKNASFLFGALRANATFSVLTALPLLLWPQAVAARLGFEQILVYQLLGVALVLFAVGLVWQTLLHQVAGLLALITCIADLTWVVSTGIILAFWGDVFTSAGRITLLAVAGVVLLLAVLQWHGLGRVFTRSERSGWGYYCVSFEVDAPRDAVWSVVSDLAAIDQYADALADASIVAGENGAVGCVRQCLDHANKVWREEVTEIVEGSHFILRFRHEDRDFPFPVAGMVGAWRLFEEGRERTRVEASWDVRPKWWLPKQVMMPLLVFQNGRMLPRLAAKMALAAEGKPFESVSDAANLKGLRLGVC